MDKFGKRAAMLSALDKIREKGTLLQKQKANGQVSLFDNNSKDDVSFTDDLPKIEEFTREELLSLERSLLGFYLTENPLSPLLTKIDNYRSHKIYQLNKDEHRNQKVKIAGVVSELRTVFTKNTNQEMAFAKIEDDSGRIEVVVFPKIFSQTRSCWVKDRLVITEGKIEYREEKLSILVEKAQTIESIEEEKTNNSRDFDFEIRLPARISPQKLVSLNKLLKQNQGKNKIALVFIDNLGREKRMILPFGVNYNQKLQNEIKKIIEN